MTKRETQVAKVTIEQLVDEAMREVHERMAALEEALANAQAATAANGTGAKRAVAKDRLTGGNGRPRWLDSARYANRCQGACGGRVEQGERCWYVPGQGVWHEACAPAEANTQVAA